jgi:hypothetical protein
MNPAFVEKDWYFAQVVRALAEFDHQNFAMICSGRTALHLEGGVPASQAIR